MRSTPDPVIASRQWKLGIAIYWKANAILNLQPFSGPTTYHSEEEADIHGFAYGQRIIDEMMSGLKAG